MHFTSEGTYTYGDVLVDYLKLLNIDIVFGVPGGAIEPFMNALSRAANRGGPKVVIARHETGAAFMADGYYRETGKMGVVFSTTGPGTTNLVTGVANAHCDNIPMLVITAQTPLPKFGRRALQESSCTSVDTVGLFKSITCYNTLISHVDQIETKLSSAVFNAHQYSKPVHISIPSDVLRQDTTRKIIQVPHPPYLKTVDIEAIEHLKIVIERDTNIIVYVGDYCRDASAAIMEFIKLTDLPFVSSPIGKSWVDETNPNYLGVYGFAGHDSAKSAIHSNIFETVIIIGAALDELSTSGWSQDLINTKLVHIDSKVEHFTRSKSAQLHVLGNINTIFSMINNHIVHLKKSGLIWDNKLQKQPLNVCNGYSSLRNSDECLSDDLPIKPQRLMYHLSNHLPDDTRIYIDAGNAWSWCTHYLTRKDSLGFYNIAMGFGSMAWSIGASIGAKSANNKNCVISIVGDGSFLMSSHEITVAVQHKLPVIFVVLNDSAMGMVYHGQKLGGQESIGWELEPTDFSAIAKAYGANGIIIDSIEKLNAIDFNELNSLSGPTLLDIRIDRHEVPPMGDRIKGLAKQSATPGS